MKKPLKDEDYPWINRFSEAMTLADHRKNIKAAEAQGMTLVRVCREDGVYIAHFLEPDESFSKAK